MLIAGSSVVWATWSENFGDTKASTPPSPLAPLGHPRGVLPTPGLYARLGEADVIGTDRCDSRDGSGMVPPHK